MDMMMMMTTGSMGDNHKNMSGMDMSGMKHHMWMWFHFATDDVILFDFWAPTNALEMIGSCIGIFILAILSEALKSYRRQLQYKSSLIMVDDRSMIANNTSNIRSTNRYTNYLLRLFTIPHLIQTCLFGMQILVSYILMLIFMTFNVWLDLTVILGIGVGYFVFCSQYDVQPMTVSKKAMVVVTEDESNNCCG